MHAKANSSSSQARVHFPTDFVAQAVKNLVYRGFERTWRGWLAPSVVASLANKRATGWGGVDGGGKLSPERLRPAGGAITCCGKTEARSVALPKEKPT